MSRLRPAFPYFGSKWRLAPWILAHLPPHTVYVEPYAGSAALLLAKPPSAIEVLNDLDDGIVVFFRCLRDRPGELLAALRLTPYARAEHAAAIADELVEDLERARRWYVLTVQSYAGGGSGHGRQGWYPPRPGYNRRTVALWADHTHLRHVADRLRGVAIEHDDALAVLARYDSPGTLTYLDPPYPRPARGRSWRGRGYCHELEEAGHHQLLDYLLTCLRGAAVLSCGAAPTLYHEPLTAAGWRRVTHPQRPEALYLSP